MAVAMIGACQALLLDWREYYCRQAGLNKSKAFADLELGAITKTPKRIGSGLSLKTLAPADRMYTTSDSINVQDWEPIFLTFNMNDEVYTKPLDYGTFAQWGAMAGLMADIENDGLAPGGLWDVLEDMKVCSGDWDARVCQGWEIRMHCRDDAYSSETDSDSGSCSDDFEFIEKIVSYYEDTAEGTEDWCLPRWRRRVEQERSVCGKGREPSWKFLALGCASMIFFLVTVIVYTA